jgi:hypothetical protein
MEVRDPHRGEPCSYEQADLRRSLGHSQLPGGSFQFAAVRATFLDRRGWRSQDLLLPEMFAPAHRV